MGLISEPNRRPKRITENGERTSSPQGKIVQCIGAVVDVEFRATRTCRGVRRPEDRRLGADAGSAAAALGDGVVRTIALGSSDGLRRGLMVTTPAPITVPVGKATLGRIMDVLGNPSTSAARSTA